MTRYDHAGGAVPSPLTNSMTDVSVDPFRIDATTGWPDGTDGPFFIVIDRGLIAEEKILISGRSGDELTIFERGADDTTPKAHAAGAIVEHVFTAVEADEANAHVNDTAGDPHNTLQQQEFIDAVDGQIAAAKPATYADHDEGSGDPSLTTTVHALPYPDTTDDLRVQAALQLLAEALDGKVPIVLYGTGEPPEPASGFPDGTTYFRTEA